MRGRAGHVARVAGAAISCVAIVASAGTASAAPKAKQEARDWPALLRGTVTGSDTTISEGSTSTHRWQIDGLKLKRERVKVMRTQMQVVYRAVAGTVTWSYVDTDYCGRPVSFTETFSLKGSKWDRDSRITFFAPREGRFKNRWRVDGQLDLIRDKYVGCPNGVGDPELIGYIRLPSMVSGAGVGATPPVARPGKKVRLAFASRYGSGTVYEHEDTLTIRIPR
jgi:hypothetical protein